MPELNVQNYVFGSNYLTVLLAILMRWCIALHSYSGEKKPPMFGDYEAQRHWMEITYNLPVQDWYKNTENNNLTYWGLDYPPLTAYHSFVAGFFASKFVPESVELHSSKGHETYRHKLFMRYSVLIVDLLIYIPAVFVYFKTNRKSKDSCSWTLCVLFLLLYPGLILIDYGHFQYNCVSLGLFVAAVAAIFGQHFRTAALLFSLAVNYKQMELYHSLPFFFFFLGKFFAFAKKGMFSTAAKFLVSIGTIVLTTFLVLWFPFLSNTTDFLQVLRRVFPVDRGIYEDKVSTFWCVLNVVYKIHRNVENAIMLQICLWVTLISVLPSVLDLMLNPTKEKFKYSLIVSSLCFFLFSYHVHEKSILLAAVPVALDFARQPLVTCWFLSVSTFSMLPLLIVDRLFAPYMATFVFYNLCCWVLLRRYDVNLMVTKIARIRLKTVVTISVTGCLLLSSVARFCPSPARYPYLWSLLICCYSFVHFFGFLFYYYSKQFGPSFLKRKRN